MPLIEPVKNDNAGSSWRIGRGANGVNQGEGGFDKRTIIIIYVRVHICILACKGIGTHIEI